MILRTRVLIPFLILVIGCSATPPSKDVLRAEETRGEPRQVTPEILIEQIEKTDPEPDAISPEVTIAPLPEPVRRVQVRGLPEKYRRPAQEQRLDRREHEPKGWTLPMPTIERNHPDLGFGGSGSISVGTVVSGYLVRGREVPLVGEHHRILEEHSRRGTRWGTDELVKAVLDAAKAVAEAHPGSFLGVANIAQQGGGRLPWSISHRAGRDVDLAFYLVDDEGQQVQPDSLYKLAPSEGTMEWQGRTLRYDVPRNYELVTSLLASKQVRVQYIFVADFLVEKLRAEARRRDAPWRIRKALDERVRQPRGTLPHDDHYHMRVYCSPEDELEGCRNIERGSILPPSDRRAFEERLKAIRSKLSDKDPAQRAGAARLLGILGRDSVIGDLKKLLADEAVEVRREGLLAYERLGGELKGKRLERLLTEETDPAMVEAAFRMLRAGGDRHWRIARRLLADPRVLPDTRLFADGMLVVRREAALAAGWMPESRLFSPLVDLLSDPDPDVRSTANWALELLTNHSLCSRLTPCPDPAIATERWKTWRKKAGRRRKHWVRKGFELAGFDRVRKKRRTALRLADWIGKGPPYQAFNAQLLLKKWCPLQGPRMGFQGRWFIRKRWKSTIRKCFK